MQIMLIILVASHINQLESWTNWNISKGNWMECWFDQVIDSPVWIPHSGNSPNSIWFFLDIENTKLFLISISCRVIKLIGIAFCGFSLAIGELLKSLSLGVIHLSAFTNVVLY